MRVAFLTNFIPPYRKPLLDALARKVDHLRVFVSTETEPNRDWTPDWSGLDVVRQKTISLSRQTVPLHIPFDTFKQLKAFNPDVVVSGEMGPRTLLAAAYRFFHCEARLIVWADISESTERKCGLIRRCLRAIICRHGDLFLVNGKSGARYLNTLGVPGERIAAVPSTVDVAAFATAPLDRPSQRLLYVGQLIHRKGLLPFASVLRNWSLANPSRQIEWVIAGEGPLDHALRTLALPPNLSLRLAGSVPYKDLPELYSESSVLVLPSIAESWGLVVNEAMASGLPVLGSMASQAVEELVTDGVTGWTFHPGSEAEMAAALDRCLNTRGEGLLEMRAEARRTALNLSPDIVAEMIHAAIRAEPKVNLVFVDANHS